MDSSACCCGLRSSRLSDPTNNQLVPLAAAGRSVYSLNTTIRRRDESIQIVVVSIAMTMISPKVKVLNTIRLPQRAFFLAVARVRLGGCGGPVGLLTAGWRGGGAGRDGGRTERVCWGGIGARGSIWGVRRGGGGRKVGSRRMTGTDS